MTGSRLDRLAEAAPAHGAFVAIVGPSGAGKDTIIAGARLALDADPRFVFPRRVITRAADATEASIALSEEAFCEQARQGAFLLWWRANGLSYGLPIAHAADLAAGRHVIANVSRAITDEIRTRFPAHLIIQIEARPEILRERLASRGREDAGSQQARIERNQTLHGVTQADIRIENNGAADAAIRQLVETLKGLGAVPAAKGSPGP